MKARRVLGILLSSGLLATAQESDPARFRGHVFPGATLPWGSVKAGADSKSNDNQAGFVSDGTPIVGLSSMHDDGTGGGKSLGNFPFLPLTSKNCAQNDLTKCTTTAIPTASPGYFAIPLKNGVNAEVTVTQHTSLHRFTYEPGTEQMLFLIDVTGDLGGSWHLEDGHVTVSPNPKTKGTRVTGMSAFIPSFGQSYYKLYFCFDAPDTFVQAKYYETSGGMKYTDLNSTGTFDHVIQRSGMAGVLMGFAPGSSRILSARMGISWTSTDRACAYAEEEVPDIFAFDTVHAAARAKWNEVLGTVEVDATGVSASTQELFWSSLYRTYIAPTNITGDNPLWESTEPYWDSFYCIWDTFRVVHPLYAITAPIAQAEIIRALIDIYRHAGWLPDCRMSLDKGFTQGGSNADSLLADSYIKGIKAGIDWEDGFKAMVKDATVMGDFEVEGRGNINSREKYGYIPVHDNDHPQSAGANTRSGSRLLEYVYNDFDIALVAQGLNKTAEMYHYFNKSADWYNIWNPDAEHSGFGGFIQPRRADGSWYYEGYERDGNYRPDHCSPVFGHDSCYGGYGGGEFYEASSWEYSFYVPHDMATLVDIMGGPKTFSARLDHFFEAGFHDLGDEPGFLPTYLYNYVGEPAKTVDRVDSMISLYYNTSVDGLPGNDDSGSMGAYVVWSHLGFYPVAGQDTYLLNRPYFPKITIRNQDTGAVSIVIASGLSERNKYIQSATLNGKPYTKNWLSHDFFRYGGTLKLVMGSSKKSSWGTGKDDIPMSLSTKGFGCDTCVSPAKLHGNETSTGSGLSNSPSQVPDTGAVVHDGANTVQEDASSKPNGFFSYLIFLLLAD
ncbi:glycoside hydrolase family 92 protein [Favolaschia claudopus]|uniref:Glycoside hydrolase family 92 protein n=1 Tax=Favolaschia claudopus TaxID=2862362 RepID=A0AAW0DVR0_9AGAR